MVVQHLAEMASFARGSIKRVTSLITDQIGHDFSELHQRMQWYVDEELIPCCATLVMHGTSVVDMGLFGYMDLESREPLRADAIYRMYSNTKLITSVAAMILHERGLFDLDEPIEMYLPEFSDMHVLRVDAESLEDTVPAENSITPRHLLSHTAGLSYGFLEPESLIDQGYLAGGIVISGGDDEPLADLCGRLGEFPLVFQPGTGWRYSFATDVLARLIEVLSGDRFDSFLDANILSALEMVDTGFHVPPEKQDRFVTMYAGPDPMDYMKPGLSKVDDPRTGEYSRPKKLQSGGGGLVSTLQDYAAFIRMIVGGGQWHGRRIIAEETLSLMRTNQLAEGVHVNFPDLPLPGTVFGLGFSLLKAPGPEDPPGSNDQYGWGGMAGTSSWIAPNTHLAGICFTQRMPASFHPYIDDFRRLAYASG